nr:uncharacterized protein DDB_G0275275-like [Bactrocera oleae]
MNNMADEDNNNNNSDSNNKKVNSNVNYNNSPNCNRSRANANCDAKKLAKNLTNKPSSSAVAGEASKSERCVLCLDEKRSPVRITCGHSFCNECLEVYLSYQKYAWANRCPICRGSLKEKRRSVKRKHSETDHTTASATMSINAGSSSTSQYTPTRRRLNATSATVAAATAAVATATATALSESTVEASAEQIYLLEEFMAIAAETDVFGIANSMSFGNLASATTPTNSASTVSASEAAGEDDEGDLQTVEFEEEMERGFRYSQDDFASDIGDEEGLEEEDDGDEEVFGEDIDVEQDEEFEDEEDDSDNDIDAGDHDEANDLYFFDEYDDENYNDHENDGYDTVDEDDGDNVAGSDAYDQLADNNLPTAEYYDVDQDGEDDVLLVDEVIIVD